jgi:hypothetical protein
VLCVGWRFVLTALNLDCDLAGLSTTSMHVQFSQHEVISEITNTHVFTTSASTDFTFVRDISVQLLQVRASATSYLKFALVELTVPPGLSASALEGIIPAESLRASIGYTVSTAAAAVYPCRDLYAGAGRTQIDAVLAGQSDCAPQHPVCAAGGPAAVGAGDKVSFMLPLDPQWWSEAELDNTAQALLHEHVFLDFMVAVQDAQGKRSLARMQTRTEVTRLSVASHCERVQLQNGIAGMLQIDVLLGLASTEATYTDSVIEYSDVASSGTSGTLAVARNVSSPAANTVTLVVTGDDALFTQEFALGYSLEIEDFSSVHVIDADKRTAVDALMAGGSAFAKHEDAQSYSIMRYQPTTELLQQCPVQQTRGVRGCATRRDIRERMPDFTSQSIIEIGPEGPIDEEATFARTGAWLQRHLGQSQFIYDLGYNHSKIVHQRYRLDQRYRRAFVITPTTPWSSAQMLSAGVASVLDLAQHTVMSFLVALDRNDDVSTIPTVEMDVPSTLQVSGEELLNDPALQEAVEASYAEATGVQEDNVVLDESSIQDTGARRRLLAPAACQFKLRIEIVIKDEAEAMDFAENLRTELVKDDSPVVASLLSNLNTKVRAVKPEIPAITSKDDFLPDTLVIPPPKKAPGCRNVDTWEREVTSLLGLGLSHTDANGNPVTGWVSCSQRYYKLAGGGAASGAGMLMPNTTIRGASQASDWQRFYDADTGTYPHVTDPAQQKYHWEWWDMCGDPPRGDFYSGHMNDFARNWADIQAEARQQCCLCRRQPLVPNSFTKYVHQYSWPLSVDSTSDNFYDVDRADTLLLNTQSANFANKRSKNFAASSMFLPETWSIEAGTGRTVTTACQAGEYERRPGQCIACAVGKYRPLEAEHTQRTRCLACPASKSSPAGSVSLDACVCGAGFQPDAGVGCDACPANTYKDAPGDWPCLACPDGSIASPGATSAAQCVTQQAYTDTLGRTRLYVSVLGALMHLDYVEPNWATPAPAEQDNSRMCTVSADGTALNCPGATHPNAFSKPLVFPTADDTIAQIEYDTDDIFQRSNVLYYHGGNGYPCRLKFYLTPEPSYQFQVNGQDRADLKRLVNHVGFKLRPHYMGPAPPGLTERVLEDAAWGATTVLTTSLRALVPGLDLAIAAPAQVLRLVQFVATKRLDVSATGTDWRWVVCGQAAPENHAHAFVYGKCAAGADPDNAGSSNVASEHVLDLRVFELSKTDAAAKSCFYKHWWVDGCNAIASTGLSPDAAEMYDGVLHWEPAIPPAQRSAEQLWVYTYFMLGDSEACLQHNCDEAAVYAQMPVHVSAPWQSTWDTEIQLLPGTAVTLHEREPVPVHTTPLFDTTIGLLRAGDACTVAADSGGGLECADHSQVRSYPGLYAPVVDATTLAAGVTVEPVTSAVPHAPVFEHEGQAVAAVAAKIPGLGVAVGQTAEASVYVRKETEVPCGDVCAAGYMGHEPDCTACALGTYDATVYPDIPPITPIFALLPISAYGSWDDHAQSAMNAGGRLPTRAEVLDNLNYDTSMNHLINSGLNVDSRDIWIPVSDLAGAWLEIGDHPHWPHSNYKMVTPTGTEDFSDGAWQTSDYVNEGSWAPLQMLFYMHTEHLKEGFGLLPTAGERSWDAYAQTAADAGGRLPTRAELISNLNGDTSNNHLINPAINPTTKDVWVPVSDFTGAFVEIGDYPAHGNYKMKTSAGGQAYAEGTTEVSIASNQKWAGNSQAQWLPSTNIYFVSLTEIPDFEKHSTCTPCPANTDTGGQTAQSACVCSAGYEPPASAGDPCTPCPSGTAKVASGDAACSACPADTYSPAGATACTACPAGSDTGGASSQSTCTCADGLVFTADGRCDWAPSAWAGADPTGYAYTSVERLYPPVALREANPGFASADDASPDVHTFATGDTTYAPGRYAVAYSSIDTAPGYTGFGPSNVLRHGEGLTAQHDGNWAPAQYSGGAYTGTADLTGTLAGEWFVLELPVAVMPTRIVIATNGLDPATVAYAPHHIALYAYGTAGAWVKLHEEVLTAASYTHTLTQAGDSYALELSGVTACYHIFALVVPTVGASADALSFGELQIFGREKYAECPSGTEVDADNVCQVVEASFSPYAVSFAVSLPLTEAEFDATAQTAYKESVATVASVETTAVSIDSVTAVARRRRLLNAGIEVETSVQATSSAAATSISTSITIEALNTQLDTAGLPAASMVSAPAVVQNTCLLPGFHISGTGLVAATV